MIWYGYHREKPLFCSCYKQRGVLADKPTPFESLILAMVQYLCSWDGSDDWALLTWSQSYPCVGLTSLIVAFLARADPEGGDRGPDPVENYKLLYDALEILVQTPSRNNGTRVQLLLVGGMYGALWNTLMTKSFHDPAPLQKFSGSAHVRVIYRMCLGWNCPPLVLLLLIILFSCFPFRCFMYLSVLLVYVTCKLMPLLPLLVS